MNDAKALIDRAEDGDAQAAAALRAIVVNYREQDPETYSRALNRTELFADGSLEEPLLSALAEDGHRCRMWVARACGRLDIRAAWPLLVGLLVDADPMVREAACEALGRLSTREAFDGLAQALDDDVENVRVAAAKALVSLGGDEAIACLWEAFESSPFQRRYYLADIVGELGLVDRLLAAASDKDADLRFWVARALGRVNDPRAIPALQHLATDLGRTRTTAFVATAARKALRRHGIDVQAQPS